MPEHPSLQRDTPSLVSTTRLLHHQWGVVLQLIHGVLQENLQCICSMLRKLPVTGMVFEFACLIHVHLVYVIRQISWHIVYSAVTFAEYACRNSNPDSECEKCAQRNAGRTCIISAGSLRKQTWSCPSSGGFQGHTASSEDRPFSSSF